MRFFFALKRTYSSIERYNALLSFVQMSAFIRIYILTTSFSMLFITSFTQAKTIATGNEAPGDSVLLKADSLFLHEEFSKALELYHLFITNSPDSAQGYLGACMVYEELNETNEAYYICSKGLGRAKKPFKLYSWRGKFSLKYGETDRAYDDLKIAFDLARNEGERIEALIGLSSVTIYTQQYSEAESILNEALILRPEELSILINLAHVEEKLMQPEKAIFHLQQAVELYPTSEVAIGNLAYFYLTHERIDTAIYIYTGLLEDHPEDPLILNNLGYAMYLTGAHENALEYINKSIALYPANSYAWKNKALVLIQQDRLSEACTALKEAKRLGFASYYGKDVDELLQNHCKSID